MGEEIVSQNVENIEVLKDGLASLPCNLEDTFSPTLNVDEPNDKVSNIESIENIFVDPILREKIDDFDWDADAFARERGSSLDDESLQLSWKSFEGTIMHIDENSVATHCTQQTLHTDQSAGGGGRVGFPSRKKTSL